MPPPHGTWTLLWSMTEQAGRCRWMKMWHRPFSEAWTAPWQMCRRMWNRRTCTDEKQNTINARALAYPKPGIFFLYKKSRYNFYKQQNKNRDHNGANNLRPVFYHHTGTDVVPAMLNTAAASPREITILPLEKKAARAARLEARLTSFVLPEAVRISMPARPV